MIAAALLALASDAAGECAVRFTDVASAARLNFTHTRGATPEHRLPESMCFTSFLPTGIGASVYRRACGAKPRADVNKSLFPEPRPSAACADGSRCGGWAWCP